jgi:uncharacterized protein (DUF302 family)
MLTRAKFLRLSGVAAAAMAVTPAAAAEKSNDGVVRIKSAYGFAETIERLKKDIAAKGIMFFSEIDQSKLASGAGIKLNPSTLLMFGNPPLGTQFMTSNPNAGLDWPVRLLVIQDNAGAVWTVYTFRLDRRAPRHRQPRRPVQDGVYGDRIDHVERQSLNE